MPLPTPEPDEREADFIGRCMAALSDEFPDAAQRAAVCHRQWQQKGGTMSGTKEFKGLRVELKDAEKGEVEAIFATFGVVDDDGDWTEPGAFEQGAKVRISAYGHESWFGQLPVGKGIIGTTDREARLVGQFFLSTAQGRETFETVKQMGELQQWSYGFDVLERAEPSEDLRQQGVRRILKRLLVHEVSPVLVGSGIGTRTLAVKAVQDAEATARETEFRSHALRELARFERTRARLSGLGV